ncbi:helicase associated domain-containing protein [Leucobacter weissii]|uniref:Helicase associated domain-containing protein n=1 Tax=Leucobacter weissii TaxID=1983706 RepID=A0A939ML24_9MICO|nr:helicase associated domain-containing protein [Leucobacter weissii]MBO1900607.1 helicase associated domain-containing protein [Leucobacter weissii]
MTVTLVSDDWEHRFAACLAWMRTHDSHPSPREAQSPEEQRLGVWLEHQVALAEVGELPTGRFLRLREAGLWQAGRRRWRTPPRRRWRPPIINDRAAKWARIPESAAQDIRAAADVWDVRSAAHHLHAAGWRLSEIGAMLQTSSSGAGTYCAEYRPDKDRCPERDYGLAPRLRLAEQRHQAARQRKRRINGCRSRDPILQLPVEKLTRLVALHDALAEVGHHTSAATRSDVWTAEFRGLLVELAERGGVTLTGLARVTGLDRDVLRTAARP